jgi:hypothetical protein
MTAPLFESHRESDSLLVMRASGSMDAVAMEVALDMLVAEVEGMHHGNMLMYAEGVEWPSLGAIGVELRHWAQLMAMVEKIDRVAVLTDEAWVRAITMAESALIPNLVIKAFPIDKEADARAWLAEASA